MSIEDLQTLTRASVVSVLTAEPATPNVVNIANGKGMVHILAFADLDTEAITEYCRIQLDDVDTGTVTLGDLGAELAIVLKQVLLNGISTLISSADFMQMLPVKFTKQLKISTWRSAAGTNGLRCRVLYALVTQ